MARTLTMVLCGFLLLVEAVQDGIVERLALENGETLKRGFWPGRKRGHRQDFGFDFQHNFGIPPIIAPPVPPVRFGPFVKPMVPLPFFPSRSEENDYGSSEDERSDEYEYGHGYGHGRGHKHGHGHGYGHHGHGHKHGHHRPHYNHGHGHHGNYADSDEDTSIEASTEETTLYTTTTTTTSLPRPTTARTTTTTKLSTPTTAKTTTTTPLSITSDETSNGNIYEYIDGFPVILVKDKWIRR